MRTFAILPVKGFDQAKQRLSGELAPKLRRALVEAMLEDVLDALGSAESIDTVLVVAGDDNAERVARRHVSHVITDTDRGHNPAAARGIAWASELGADRVLLVPGDCPALDPGELDGLLAGDAGSPSVAIVPDRHGTGTNALLLTPPDAMAPSFGPGSCARHADLARAAGIESRVVAVASLALDVDTAEDLDALSASAGRRAPRTLALLARC